VLERFAPAARQAVLDARSEAGLAGQDRVRSEHLLIGILAEPGEAAEAMAAAGLTVEDLRARVPHGKHAPPPDLDADALASLGIDLDSVRRATDATFGPGALDRVRLPGQKRVPAADDFRQTLAGALRQATRLGHQEITSGHMLLGIIDQPRNGALTLLAEAGTDVNALRADVLHRITSAA
jgi:ATP-dependent Clp protease ATP-binding subunit ClpA